jgi:hypothetical protein
MVAIFPVSTFVPPDITNFRFDTIDCLVTWVQNAKNLQKNANSALSPELLIGYS